MTDRLLIVTMLFLLAFSPAGLEAADWKSVADLKGSWHFTIGDDISWADPDTDISDWDRINVPHFWEKYYPGYNGFAWYRKSFDFNNTADVEMYSLFLGFIDDADEVFINGKKIGQTGGFPPKFETAFKQERVYQVPADILKPYDNIICVRIYDEGGHGGIIHGNRIGIYFDRDVNLLDINLSGTWKFSPDYWKGHRNPEFDDREWNDIYVPAKWENQGFERLDGRAWYRKRFFVPNELLKEDLYLILGKIDDFEEVFLNGKLIGEVEELPNYSRFRRGNAYQLFRAYRIPKDLLRHKNVLVVEVEDMYGYGGIYEGPVGIIERNKARELSERYRWKYRNNGWNSFLNDLLDLLLD